LDEESALSKVLQTQGNSTQKSADIASSGFLSAVPMFEESKIILALDRVVLHVVVVIVVIVVATATIFLHVMSGSGAHPASNPVGTGVLSPGVKWPGPEADHPIPYRAEVKNAWIYTSTSPYVFMSSA
jgi:hypothetical protein